MADFGLPPKQIGEMENPFATSESGPLETVDFYELSRAVQIRSGHIEAETALRQTGILLLSYSILTILLSFFATFFLEALAYANKEFALGFNLYSNLFLMIGITLMQFFFGIGLLKLKNQARISSVVVIVFFVIYGITDIQSMANYFYQYLFALGFFYFLYNKKAAYVCTPEYAEIRKLTPHIDNKTSLAFKMLIALPILYFLMFMMGLAFLIFLFGVFYLNSVS